MHSHFLPYSGKWQSEDTNLQCISACDKCTSMADGKTHGSADQQPEEEEEPFYFDPDLFVNRECVPTGELPLPER